jgi:predicted RNase H-like HicB family nuclease
MKNTIRIEIKEHNDFTHPYFLATSPDVYGFLVQGNSVEEVLYLVPQVLSVFLEEIQNIRREEEAEMKEKSLFDFNKNIMMQYHYEAPLVLQLA